MKALKPDLKGVFSGAACYRLFCGIKDGCP